MRHGVLISCSSRGLCAFTGPVSIDDVGMLVIVLVIVLLALLLLWNRMPSCRRRVSPEAVCLLSLSWWSCMVGLVYVLHDQSLLEQLLREQNQKLELQNQKLELEHTLHAGRLEQLLREQNQKEHTLHLADDRWQQQHPRPRPALVMHGKMTHTLGAEEYGLLSYLTLAMQAPKALPDRAVIVLDPEMRSGLLQSLYTRASLVSLAELSGFAFGFQGPLYERGGCDISVGNEGLPNKGPQQRLTAFFTHIWDRVRQVADQYPLRNVHVCFNILVHVEQPVYHAHAVFPKEQRLLFQTLRFNNYGLDGNSSKCAYYFRRFELSYNTSVEPPTSYLGEEEKHVIQHSRSANLGCVRVNTLTLPKDAPAHLLTTAFASLQSRMDKQAVQGDLKPQRSIVAQQAMKPANALQLGDAQHGKGMDDNLKERYLASIAPLFITQRSHWSDSILYMRAANSLPSVVFDAPLSETLGDFLCNSTHPCTNCAFYMGTCIKREENWTQVGGWATDFGDAMASLVFHIGRKRCVWCGKPLPGFESGLAAFQQRRVGAENYVRSHH